MRSTCGQGELNKWLNRDLHQLKQFCAEYGLETFPAKSVEICLMAINFAEMTDSWIFMVMFLATNIRQVIEGDIEVIS